MGEEKVNKQKTGLGAIRPDDDIENKFKEKAKEYGSQTLLFEHMWRLFIGEEKKAELDKAINFDPELWLIDYNLESILKTFKNIAEKAQQTITSERSSSETKIKSLELELQTERQNKLDLENANKELTDKVNSNEVVRSSLEDKNSKLEEMNKKLQAELNSSKLEEADNVKKILSLENEARKYMDQIRELESKYAANEKEISSYRNSLNAKDDQITNLTNRLNETKANFEEDRASYKEKIKEMKAKFDEEMTEYKERIKEKAEIERDKAILAIEKKYNELNVQYVEVSKDNMNKNRIIEANEKSIKQLEIDVQKQVEIIEEITSSSKKEKK